MTNFLETILARKREEVAFRSTATPIHQLEGRPAFHAPTISLSAALKGKGLAIIAEIKKASPSKGILRDPFDHREIAQQYVAGGAHALSVLTDKDAFLGDVRYLEEVSTLVSLPLLRKDFILDSYQLYESKSYGADAVLLIAAALDPQHLADLLHEAEELGLECLVEVHNEKEIASLDGIRISLFGINNRNLMTFEIDIETSFRLKGLLPPDAVVVSESGITSVDEVKQLARHGIHAVLIGELFMRSADPGKALREFLREGEGLW